MKSRRQGLILELIEREAVRSQDALRRKLKARGFITTQATISRDIRDLGLVKRAVDGAYQRPGVNGGDTLRSPLSALEHIATEFLRTVERAKHLVVIRTGTGQAQPLAVAMDRAMLPEALGTIAGDDTILVVARDDRRAAALVKRLQRYASSP